MRSAAGIVILVASLLGPAQGRAAGGGALDLTPAERAFVAAEVHTLVRLYFAHWEAVPELDLDAAFQAYLEEAMAAPDRRGFDLATHAFFARLQNGQTRFEDGVGCPGLPVGLEVRPSGDQWVVTASRLAAVRPGDVVAAVDGEPVERFFEGKRRWLAGSSERARRARLFGTPIAFPARFELLLADGRRVAVDRLGQKLSPVAAPRVDGRWLEPGRVAYVRLPRFGDPSLEEEALRFLDHYRDAQAIVIDVRGNPGGANPAQLLARLMDRPWRGLSTSTQVTVALARAHGELASAADVGDAEAAWLRGSATFGSPQLYWASPVTPAAPGAYGGRVFLLVDAGCAAGCEAFVAPFKDNGRAVLVGEATAGAGSAPFVRELPNGMRISIGAKRERMPDGSPLEGVGIAPDVPVESTAADLRAGKDPVLDAAARLAAPAPAR